MPSTYDRTGPTIKSNEWRRLVAKARKTLEPVCCFCGSDIDMTLPSRSRWACTVHHMNARGWGGPTIVPLDELRLAHNYCNARDGARIKNAPRGKRQPVIENQVALELEAESLGPRPTLPVPCDFSLPTAEPDGAPGVSFDSDEDRTGYLDPSTYNPPRLETPPGSDVVGSLGDEAVAWLDRWLGVRLWPWQQHVLTRALEVRADGSFRWPVVVLTVPRQCGKSYLSRGALAWRLHQADRFGEPQTLLHMSAQRQIARELWKQSARELEAKAGAKVRMSNGQESIELPDTSQWIVAAATPTAAPGLSLSMVFADEAWAIDYSVLVESVLPTTLQRRDSQVWLVSTAGEHRSDLLRTFRDQALTQMDDPDTADVLLVEWSASPERAVDDPEGWREASPIWDDRRARQVAQQARMMKPNAFAQQMLNRWVVSANSWLPESAWTRCQSDAPLPPREENPGVVAIETSVEGLPIGAVLAVRGNDGRIVVRSKVAQSHAGLWRWLEDTAKERRGVTILHHPTVRVPEIRGARLVQVKAQDQVAGFAPTKEAIEDGTIAHDGNATLTEQVLMAAVWRSGDGHAQISQRASEGPVYLARCLVWAVGHELKPGSRRRHMIVSAAA